ncbi:MAG: flagellar hook-basal body complex protein [Planctomycetales bacterium]|nr:flagellar hook-basal body complex protein [Planctomycetales bacterium]
MPNALLTGVSGLLAHQRLLEVVGSNISNVNTTAFKAQRAIFADMMYETIQPATSANEGNRGGTNPNQIGLGVKISQTDRKFSQGSLENTGEQFDLAMDGPGFFVVTDGLQEFYTRSGMFSLDNEGVLVAPGGYRVKRLPGVGEPDGINPAFQIPGEDMIRVPLGASLPGVATNEVTLTGNLSAQLSEPLSTVKVSNTPFRTSSGKADELTLLNELTGINIPYQTGDTIQINGVNVDGTAVNSYMNVSDTTTLGDLVTFLDGLYDGVTTTFKDGNIVMTADEVGPSVFSMTILDQGQFDYSLQNIQESIKGQWSDSFSVPITVFDQRGGGHEVSLTFTKTDNDVWKMNADMSISDGVVLEDEISEITFNDDGTLSTTSSPVLTFAFSGIASPQSVRFSFGGSSSLEALTHYESDSDIRWTQNGTEPGTLVSVNVEADGQVQGIASNGVVFAIAQLAIAGFSNVKGLMAVGGSLYERTLNSGEPEIGLAGTGSRGEIRGGALETSNVDIAFEFTRLIVAQRGFAANARTVTVSDAMLEELTNIIR